MIQLMKFNIVYFVHSWLDIDDLLFELENNSIVCLTKFCYKVPTASYLLIESV